MRTEAAGLTFGGIAADANLLQTLRRLLERDPDRVVAVTRLADDVVDWTATQGADQVRSVAKGLVASGVQPGERVALMGS